MPVVLASQDNGTQAKGTSKIGSGIPRLQHSKLPQAKSLQQASSPTQDASRQKSLLYQKSQKTIHQRTNSNTTNPLASSANRPSESQYESKLKQASQKSSMLSDYRNDVSFSQSDSFSNQQQNSNQNCFNPSENAERNSSSIKKQIEEPIEGRVSILSEDFKSDILVATEEKNKLNPSSSPLKSVTDRNFPFGGIQPVALNF